MPIISFQALLSPAADVANRIFLALACLAGGLAVAKNMSPGSVAVRELVLAILFGACLACFVSANFYRYCNLAASAKILDLGALSRRLSRVVYLSLYLLFGANEVVAFLCNRLAPPTAEHLRSFLLAGVVILALIRAQALAWNPIVRREIARLRLPVAELQPFEGPRLPK